jgi:hypothetical protein
MFSGMKTHCWRVVILAVLLAVACASSCATHDPLQMERETILLRPANGAVADFVTIRNESVHPIEVRLLWGSDGSSVVEVPAKGEITHELAADAVKAELSADVPVAFRPKIDFSCVCTYDCLASGMLVATTSGLRCIESLVVGELVRTRRGDCRVNAIRQARSTNLVRVGIDGEEFTTSAGHRFATASGWRSADELAVGDALLLADGTTRAITATRTSTTATSVYAIELADPEATLQVGAIGVVVGTGSH